jgi:hypothetical protein
MIPPRSATRVGCPALLTQPTVHACSGDLAALGTSRASRRPQDQTQQSGTALPRSSITALQVCVSTVSIVATAVTHSGS